MANGRVITGYSQPYVALYTNTGGTVTYSSGQALARGVDVSISPEAADAIQFYADNTVAETGGGGFTGGTVTLTVDGLKGAAQKLIMGLPAASTVTVGQDTVNINDFGDGMDIPYVGIGFIVRYMEDGVTSYDAVVLTKTRFSVFGTEAATQEDAIAFQTQSLEATIYKDDTANHNWKRVSDPQTTEAAALAVIQALLA